MADEQTKEKKTPRKVVRDKAKHHVSGFADFIRTQGVVGLAVGLVIGVAAKTVIDSFVNNIFNPIVGLFTGGGDFSDKAICLRYVGENCTNNLRYGQLLSDIISFLIVALAIYLLVKGLRLEKLDKKKQ